MRRTQQFLAVLFLLALTACAVKGPINTANFDATFADIISANESIQLYSESEIRVGTYMEAEIKRVPVFQGVLLLSDHAVRFLLWNDQRKTYETKVQFSYSELAAVKSKYNSLMSSFVAVKTSDGHSYGFMLEDDMVKKASAILSAPH